MNTLVRVHGVVTRRTGVFPQLAMLYYKCHSCGETLEPLMQSGDATHEVKPQVRAAVVSVLRSITVVPMLGIDQTACSPSRISHGRVTQVPVSHVSPPQVRSNAV